MRSSFQLYQNLQKGTYGYKITQDVVRQSKYPESRFYPVLRRLQKDDCLGKHMTGRSTAETDGTK